MRKAVLGHDLQNLRQAEGDIASFSVRFMIWPEEAVLINPSVSLTSFQRSGSQ